MSVSNKNQIGNLILENPIWELFFFDWLRQNRYLSQFLQKYVQDVPLVVSEVFCCANLQVLNAYNVIISYHAQVGSDIHVTAHSAL